MLCTYQVQMDNYSAFSLINCDGRTDKKDKIYMAPQLTENVQGQNNKICETA